MQTTAVNLLSLHTRYDALGNHMGIMYGCMLDSAFVHLCISTEGYFAIQAGWHGGPKLPSTYIYCKVLCYY